MTKLILLLLVTVSLFACGQVKNNKSTSDVIPEGYVLHDSLRGDLDNDGIDDCVLIIKGTNKDHVVINRFDEEVDRNRRGIIILLKKQNGYEIVLENRDCFDSENEDGGVYFPPELSLNIEHGKLYVSYGHGRYGHWKYTFRYQHSDFELIGYDSSNGGAVIESETSINFLTKKKLHKVNTNVDAQGGDEVYNETWQDIEVTQLIKLSEITDFYELELEQF